MAKPTNKEKLDTVLKHMEWQVEDKGEEVSVKEMRKHISWYIKNMSDATKTREKINRLETKQEVIDCLTEYFNNISNKIE